MKPKSKHKTLQHRTSNRSGRQSGAVKRGHRFCESCVTELDAIAHAMQVGGVCERCDLATYPLFDVAFEPSASHIIALKLIEVACELATLTRRPSNALDTAIAMTRVATALVVGGARGR